MSALAKAATIASDAILIGLTWVKTFGISKDSSKLGMHTPFATLLLRGGTAYFMYAFEYHPPREPTAADTWHSILLLIQVITIISSNIGSVRLPWAPLYPHRPRSASVLTVPLRPANHCLARVALF